MNAISITGLVKSYGKVTALQGIDLTVPQGTIYGVVGPNGAGKTTLIKTLVGVARPTSGTVRVLELDPLNDKWALRKQIGYMPQDAALYETLSARDNIAFLGRAQSVKGLDQKALPAGKGKKKISPDAIYIDALKKVAKQIEKEHGIKLKVIQRDIFNYDPMKLYAIENKSGQVVSSFKTRQNRDFVLNRKNEASPSGEGFTALNLADGAPGSKDLNKAAFKSIVLEIPDSAAKILSKKKMSTYREGGLVAIEPKREYFAAVI